MLAFPWRLTHLLLNCTYFTTRSLILNSAIFLPYIARIHVIILIFLLFDYMTKSYIYIKTKSIQKTKQQFNEEEKRGTHQIINASKLSLWIAHLQSWGGTLIPPIPTRLCTRSLCCQSGRQSRILYQGLPLGTSRRSGNLQFP